MAPRLRRGATTHRSGAPCDRQGASVLHLTSACHNITRNTISVLAQLAGWARLGAAPLS
jgi:hypothetical protein